VVAESFRNARPVRHRRHRLPAPSAEPRQGFGVVAVQPETCCWRICFATGLQVGCDPWDEFVFDVGKTEVVFWGIRADHSDVEKCGGSGF
jgi:hypothetical protein